MAPQITDNTTVHSPAFSSQQERKYQILGSVCQKRLLRVGTRNYNKQMPWDVITCPCPWYTFLAYRPSNDILHKTVATKESNQSTIEIAYCNFIIHNIYLQQSSQCRDMFIFYDIISPFLAAILVHLYQNDYWLLEVWASTQLQEHAAGTRMDCAWQWFTTKLVPWRSGRNGLTFITTGHGRILVAA